MARTLPLLVVCSLALLPLCAPFAPPPRCPPVRLALRGGVCLARASHDSERGSTLGGGHLGPWGGPAAFGSVSEGAGAVAAGLLLGLAVLTCPAPAMGAEREALKPQNYYDQVADAMPLKSMRGVWRFKEVRGGTVCGGTLIFKGQLDQPNRGDVVLEPSAGKKSGGGEDVDVEGGGGEGACLASGKGKWLMKPSRFERATIQFNARWKLRGPEGTFVYRGDVTAEATKGKGNVPDATIKGEVLQEGDTPQNLKKVGSFEATLKAELPKDDAS